MQRAMLGLHGLDWVRDPRRISAAGIRPSCPPPPPLPGLGFALRAMPSSKTTAPSEWERASVPPCPDDPSLPEVPPAGPRAFKRPRLALPASRKPASPSTCASASTSAPTPTPTAPGKSVPEAYLCTWRKRQTKKHKTWDGDAFLLVDRPRHAARLHDCDTDRMYAPLLFPLPLACLPSVWRTGIDPLCERLASSSFFYRPVANEDELILGSIEVLVKFLAHA